MVHFPFSYIFDDQRLRRVRILKNQVPMISHDLFPASNEVLSSQLAGAIYNREVYDALEERGASGPADWWIFHHKVMRRYVKSDMILEYSWYFTRSFTLMTSDDSYHNCNLSTSPSYSSFFQALFHAFQEEQSGNVSNRTRKRLIATWVVISLAQRMRRRRQSP